MPSTAGSLRAFRSFDCITHPSAAETATGNDTAVELGDCATVRLTLAVTAASGTTPTLDVTVETSADNGVTDAWRTLGTFAQKTVVASERKSFGGCDRWVRTRRVIAGTTPSFTYSIIGEAI